MDIERDITTKCLERWKQDLVNLGDKILARDVRVHRKCFLDLLIDKTLA
jgi:hypothetical protein